MHGENGCVKPSHEATNAKPAMLYIGKHKHYCDITISSLNRFFPWALYKDCSCGVEKLSGGRFCIYTYTQKLGTNQNIAYSGRDLQFILQVDTQVSDERLL